MGGMLDKLLSWLEHSEGPLAYLVLALAGALEYVVPPIPGDTITLFGVFLSSSAEYSPYLVYIAITIGAIAGSMVPYAFGRWIGRHEDDWPFFLKHERTRRAIHTLCARFGKHGSVYLALNRFVPALRAVFFVAAGISEMHVGKVLLFGSLSALVWNGLIFAVGWSIGGNLERMQELSAQYGWGVLIVLALVLVLYGVRAAVRKRRAAG